MTEKNLIIIVKINSSLAIDCVVPQALIKGLSSSAQNLIHDLTNQKNENITMPMCQREKKKLLSGQKAFVHWKQ